MIQCTKCGEEFPESEKKRKSLRCRPCRLRSDKAWKDKNKDRVREWNKKWNKENPEKVREKNLLRNYGMSLVDFDLLMKKQGGLCAICRCGLVAGSSNVDHDHGDNSIRGILCGNCNKGIGFLGDSYEIAQRATEYLRRHWENRVVVMAAEADSMIFEEAPN